MLRTGLRSVAPRATRRPCHGPRTPPFVEAHHIAKRTESAEAHARRHGSPPSPATSPTGPSLEAFGISPRYFDRRAAILACFASAIAAATTRRRRVGSGREYYPTGRQGDKGAGREA